jgi:hypothetical protein
MPIFLRILTAATLALLFTAAAGATQHLVRPGENWQSLDARLKPGDEIILMPGLHRPATLGAAQGTAGQPIVIRGLDPNHPSTIQAEGYGIRLLRPGHVRIADLIITGATIHGIFLEGDAEGADGADEEDAEPRQPPGHATLTSITVRDTGPKGLRHAIHIRQMDSVRIENCRVEGWAGSAVEIVACNDVTIEDCRFAGKEEYSQTTGVRIRAGSDRVNINRSRFIDAGDQGVCLGGASDLEEFRPQPPADAKPASLYEASRVQVMRCTFQNGLCALAFIACERCTVRNCTILRPRQAVVSIRREQEDQRFGPTASCVFGSNLITWQAGDLTTLTHLAGGATTGGITLEDNLWWTAGFEEQKEQLGPFPGTEAFPQVTDVDPKLDDQLKPTAEEARLYGADPL